MFVFHTQIQKATRCGPQVNGAEMNDYSCDTPDPEIMKTVYSDTSCMMYTAMDVPEQGPFCVAV